jgi:predicted AAA+ superfamily ATPase
MAAELKEAFDLQRAMDFGTIPLAWHASDARKRLHAYLHLYLREEVQSEGLTRNLFTFNRFLEFISFSHGAGLNLTNVARECGVSRKTVEGYVGILEDLMLGYRLNVFTPKAQRLLAQHPKFYFFDSGVFHTCRPIGPLDKPSEINGPALEGLVAQHFKAWCDYTHTPHTLYFWKTRTGLEVDFVIYGESGLYAVEVKNSDRLYPNDLAGLKAFRKDYPMACLFLLYRGKETLKKGDILCLSCEEFLRNLTPDRWPFSET